MAGGFLNTLSDADHAGDFRDLILEVAFNPHRESHGTRRAADAGATQAYVDDAVRINVHQLDVATVALQQWS